MDNFENYDNQCEAIRNDNQGILKQFSEYLKRHKLSNNTIDKHVRKYDDPDLDIEDIW
jgi:hypothetical protein